MLPAAVNLLASGRAVDLILAVLALEVIVLILYRRGSGRGPAAMDLIPNAVSGACLLLALRAALTGSAPPLIGLWLAGAFTAHLVDLRCRWRSR